MQEGKIFKFSKIIFSYLISIFVSVFIVYLYFEYSSYLSNAGLGAAIALVFFIPPLIAFMAFWIAIPVYLIVRKVKPTILSKLIIVGLTFCFLGLIAWVIFYDLIFYKYDPVKKSAQRKSQIYMQIESYRTADNEPYRIEEWSTYSNENNDFRIKLPPPLTLVQNPDGSDDYRVFYKELPIVFSSQKKNGNEIMSLKILDINSGTIDCDQIASLRKFEKNGTTFYDEYCRYIVKLDNGRRLEINKEDYHASESIRTRSKIDLLMKTLDVN